MSDSGPGGLNKTYRACLRGEHDHGPSLASTHRYKIKGRIRQGVKDGGLLWYNIDRDLRQDIFRPGERFYSEDTPDEELEYLKGEPETVEEIRDLRRGTVNWLSFLYKGVDEATNLFIQGDPQTEITESGDAVTVPNVHFDFETTLKEAIQKAESRKGKQISEFDLSVETEPIPEPPLSDVDTEELLARFERGESLEGLEIAHLRDEGVITDEELNAYYDSLTLDSGGFFGIPEKLREEVDNKEE